MAKYERQLNGDFDEFLAHCHDSILSASMSASLEETSDIAVDDVRVAIRTYERYSAFGGNRVSMNVVTVGSAGRIAVTATTSGGSQATFWKVNTVGEHTFLDTLIPAVERFAGAQ